MTIGSATRQDLPEVRALLERNGLPLDGVDELVETMLVARDGRRVIGVAALELYAGGALLRSVAVDAAARGRQVGHRLTEAALHLAEAHGAAAVFLLTTTAERFFPKLGFERIARGDVPSTVQESIEFRSACPTSAVVMRKRLAVTVLFACVHNAGRSQMAAAFFNRLADPSRARAISAGTDPAGRVHPGVIEAMREVGVDLSAATPGMLTREMGERAHVLVTMGCADECPAVSGIRREDWPLDDPAGKPLAQVREIRSEIHRRVAALVDREGWTAHSSAEPAHRGV